MMVVMVMVVVMVAVVMVVMVCASRWLLGCRRGKWNANGWLGWFWLDGWMVGTCGFPYIYVIPYMDVCFIEATREFFLFFYFDVE